MIYNVNNNVVEEFNSVISKHIVGKRINFSLRGTYLIRLCGGIRYTILNIFIYFLGSYGARCNTVTASFNFGTNYISHLHRKITNSPGMFTEKYTRKVEKSQQLSKK